MLSAGGQYILSIGYLKQQLAITGTNRMPNNSREEAFVNAFVAKAKRERYIGLLSNPKKRKKILEVLNHNFDFDEALATVIGCHQIQILLSRLEELLCSDEACYLISDDNVLDGKTFPFAQALAIAQASNWGTILDCIPGELALYWDEASPSRHCILLQKHKNPVENEY